MNIKFNALKINRLFVIVAASALLFAANRASAQSDFAPAISTLRLEVRADFDYLTLGPNSDSADRYGFRGRYFNLHMGGSLGEKFDYYFRQRIIANPGTSNLFDHTDFLYLNYKPNKNWMFRMGKDALATGGFEYDAAPIDVYNSAIYWDLFYCFQLAASVAYRSDDGNHMLMAQIANSPYVHYGANGSNNMGGEWMSGLLAYSLYWSGSMGHFKALYSANLFERSRGSFLGYIDLGNRLAYDKWDIYVDLLHHSLALDDWGKNYGVVSRLNLHVSPSLNVFLKGSYEQNRSDYDYITLGSGSLDCLALPHHSTCLYAAGVEYRPASCPSVRLHGYLGGRRETDYNPATPVTSDTFEANVGVSWNVDVRKILDKNLKK